MTEGFFSMAPTLLESLFGGFTTFFSVWQMCIMQVTPFYIAFSLGVYFLLVGSARRSNFKPMMLVMAGLALGFSFLFALIGSPEFAVGSLLLRNIHSLRFAAGVFIIVVGALMILSSLLTRFDFKARILVVISPLVGAALAIAYSPCISPVLSRIFNYTKTSTGSVYGFSLLFLYAIGMTAALTLVVSVIIFIYNVRSRRTIFRRSTTAPVVVSLVFIVLGILLVSGLMLRYKAMLVNLF